MLTVRQAAARLGVPRNTIHTAIRDGKLSARRYMLGGKRFITEADLTIFAAAHVQPLIASGQFAGNVVDQEAASGNS